MLQMLLRARQLELVGGSASEDDEEGSGSGSGSDEDGGRRRAPLYPAADCAIM